jgi:septum formation protein
VASPFILASNSPRRRALLADAGYEFEVIVPAVSETASTHLSLRELTIANATRKGMAVSRLHPRRMVLAADTLVALEGEVIGKPRGSDSCARDSAAVERTNARCLHRGLHSRSPKEDQLR